MTSTREIAWACELGVVIRAAADVHEILHASPCRDGLVLRESDLSDAFFDLRTGLAGEVLQKFVNYRARVAIVIADAARYGDRFSELALEHRTHGLVRFVASDAEAVQWLENASNAR